MNEGEFLEVFGKWMGGLTGLLLGWQLTWLPMTPPLTGAAVAFVVVILLCTIALQGLAVCCMVPIGHALARRAGTGERAGPIQ